MPPQTQQVLGGALIAIVYAGAVLGLGRAFLGLMIRKRGRIEMHGQVGVLGMNWLAFVLGQGLFGSLWLALALAGVLSPELVWGCFGAGVLALMPTCARFYGDAIDSIKKARAALRVSWGHANGYRWLVLTSALVLILRGLIALLPPSVEDALKQYLVEARVVAATQSLAFQYFLHPYYALQPLLVQMHWAALFAIANETAVTVWDYLCSLSLLSGVGLLAWWLTGSKRSAWVAAIMLLSTPAFAAMMGAGKIDNAGAQYGVGAFFCLMLFRVIGLRAALLSGLCLGWSLAGRYTNAILIPGMMVGAVLLAYFGRMKGSHSLPASEPAKVSLMVVLLMGLGASLAGMPMLVKNLLLVGCPLAPQFGCDNAYWTAIFRSVKQQNLSPSDLLFYPIIWTFARRASMLGNISPLFIGAVPMVVVLCGRSNLQRAGWFAGLLGMIALVTWLMIEPLILYTRLLLVPLALIAVPLGALIVHLDHDPRRRVQWLIRSALAAVMLLLLFDSRGAIHAGRYLASVQSRAGWYQSTVGYDIAVWLNEYVKSNERVALANYKGHRYFIAPEILLKSESAEELQWLWSIGKWRYNDIGSIGPEAWTEEMWRYFVKQGFSYIVVDKKRLKDAQSVWPDDLKGTRLTVLLEEQDNVILRIDQSL